MWDILKAVAALVGLLVLAAIAGGGQRSGPSAGGSVWTVGHGGKTGYGSWSSFRHR